MAGIVRDFIYGMILGVANIIPAVSGGTMAVLLNIYDKILFAISLRDLRKNLKFLMPLAMGCLCGIFVFSKMMAALLESYEAYINYCFIGMIIGSLPMVFKRAKYEKVKRRNVLIFIFALSFMIFLAVDSEGMPLNKTLGQICPLGPSDVLWLFFVAAVSAVAMILPGISGSLVMLLFGAYTVALEAVAIVYLPVLAPVAAGMLAGCFVGVKFIKKMLRFHPQALYFGILGLMVGSILTIYPGFAGGMDGMLCLTFMALFALLTYGFSRKS